MPPKNRYEFKALRKLMPETKKKIESFLGAANEGRFELKNPGRDMIGDMHAHFLVSEGGKIHAYGESQCIVDCNKLYVEICGTKEAGVLLVKHIAHVAKTYDLNLMISSSEPEDEVLLGGGMKVEGVDYMLSYEGDGTCEKVEIPCGCEWFEEYPDSGSECIYAISNKNGEIISSCNVSEYTDSICISAVYTDDKYRRQGFAAALIREIIFKYPEREILLHVYGENEKAVSLYNKLGFTVKETVYTYTGL